MLAGLERTPRSLPLSNPLVLTRTAGHAASFRAKLYRRTGIAPRFHSRAKRFGADLLHAHFASGGQTAIPLARSMGVPLLVTIHGADITISGTPAKYRPLMDAAARFICVSEYIRERALKAGFPAEKLIVHYIGVDRTQFPPIASMPPTGVIFVGRLVEKKGCEYLLRAMRIVQRSHPECTLTVIGDGPLRRELEALARFLNLQCCFLGAQPSAAVCHHLTRSRVVCVPSVTATNGDTEGLPIVLAEAQAMGLPAVSSVHAGIPELVESGTTGFLLPERDYKGMAEALSTLLSDDALWFRFHRAAIDRVAHQFDLAKQTDILERIYSGVA
jgi:glycosyltransferase involved in cell wall biosynthesis